MTTAWPKYSNGKGFDARQFSPEERTVLIIDERLKQLEVAVKELQKKK